MQLEQLRFEKRQNKSSAKNQYEECQENNKIFLEVIQERKRFLRSTYLRKGQDDLEKILEALHDHFKLIELTSFEELARNNPENLSAKELLDLSTRELQSLSKTLELLQIDEEDVRFDVFSMIYDMLYDNIQLRVKQNKLSQRVLNQSQLNLDKTSANFFRQNQTSVSSTLDIDTNKFFEQLRKMRANGKKADSAQHLPETARASEDSLSRSHASNMEQSGEKKHKSKKHKDKKKGKSTSKHKLSYDADPSEDFVEMENELLNESDEPGLDAGSDQDMMDILGTSARQLKRVKQKKGAQALGQGAHRGQNDDADDFYGMDGMDLDSMDFNE